MLPLFAVREKDGLSLVEWDKNDGCIKQSFKLHSNTIKVMTFSSDGKVLLWSDGVKVFLYDVSKHSMLLTLDLPRTYSIYLSPDANLICTWQPFSVSNENPNAVTNNFNIWKSANGECVHSAVHKKQTNWHPVWLLGTNLCGKFLGNSVHFFQNENFEAVKERLHIDKLDSFSVSPNSRPPHKIACFVRGSKGAPSSVRIFEYPKFAREEVLANKSFFKADSVNILWNQHATDLLVKTTVDVDTTGESYYGEQSLHYMSCSGETCIVNLSKKGPIYDVKWSPNSSQFCVVFGFMPAKACLFNRKCNLLFEFDQTPKNECYYNPQGNLLVLAGFGNLRGNIEVWNCDKNKQVSKFTSPDTTYFEWCADGTHFLTATTAPRLRVGNGYKLWHYTEGVLHEVSIPTELQEVLWQPKPAGTYPVPVIKDVSKTALAIKINEDKPTAYVPPHARGNTGNYVAAKNRFNQNDDQTVSQEEPQQALSKAAQKNKKKRDNKKRPPVANQQQHQQSNLSAEQRDVVQMAKYLLNDTEPKTPVAASNAPSAKEKEIKSLRKKLQAIEKLKLQQSQGKVLEKNQIEKLKTEQSILQELNQLGIST